MLSYTGWLKEGLLGQGPEGREPRDNLEKKQVQEYLVSSGNTEKASVAEVE